MIKNANFYAIDMPLNGKVEIQNYKKIKQLTEKKV